MGRGGALSLQTGQLGAPLSGLSVQSVQPFLERAVALRLGLCLRPQGVGRSLQLRDTRFGLLGGLAVFPNPASHLPALLKQLGTAVLRRLKHGIRAVRPLCVGQHRVLCLPQLGRCSIQFVVGSGKLPLGAGQLLLRLFLLPLQFLTLLSQPLQLVSPGQNARRPGGGTTSHGTARVEYLSVQGDNAEPVTKLPGHLHGLGQIRGYYNSPQQVGKDGGILLIKGDQAVPHPHKAILFLHPPVLKLRRTDGVHGQEGGPAGIPAFQPPNGLFAVLVPLHHDVLHGATQGDLNGHGILVRHMQQAGHRATYPPQAAPLGLSHEQLDRFGISLIHLLHFREQLDAGLQVICIHPQPIAALLRLVQFPLPGLAAHLVATDDIPGRVPVLRDLFQLFSQRFCSLLCLLCLLLLFRQLLGQLFLPVQQLLGRRS